MPIEGVQQQGNQSQFQQISKQNVKIPQELDIKGQVQSVEKGGLAILSAALGEIRRKLNKTGSLVADEFDELLALLGIGGDVEGKQLGGRKTIAKGLKEILKNLRDKTNF